MMVCDRIPRNSRSNSHFYLGPLNEFKSLSTARTTYRYPSQALALRFMEGKSLVLGWCRRRGQVSAGGRTICIRVWMVWQVSALC